MGDIVETVGDRIHYLRTSRGITQEDLADMAGLHNTYIGQVERGEKNMSILSLSKIVSALNITYGEFFEPIDIRAKSESAARKCYELVSYNSEEQQKRILHILQEINRLMQDNK